MHARGSHMSSHSPPLVCTESALQSRLDGAIFFIGGVEGVPTATPSIRTASLAGWCRGKVAGAMAVAGASSGTSAVRRLPEAPRGVAASRTFGEGASAATVGDTTGKEVSISKGDAGVGGGGPTRRIVRKGTMLTVASIGFRPNSWMDEPSCPADGREASCATVWAKLSVSPSTTSTPSFWCKGLWATTAMFWLMFVTFTVPLSPTSNRK
mmetsp:Transcript_67138/g.210048  ORF Transcript_67138/g.210048 Transcript_67138/m.210048 type:complete len:210 (-) Transcript_67138:775-1404(-)